MRRTERGFTLVEIMIVVAIIALLAAIAIPNVLRGRTTANESAAIGNARALMSSLEMFRSVNNAYPLGTAGTWLANMYTTPDPDFGPPSFAHAMDGTVCPSGVASSCVQGYRYTYASAAGTTYQLLAIPDTQGTTGTRSFFLNESGVIRHCQGPPVGTILNGPTWNTIDAAPTNPCT